MQLIKLLHASTLLCKSQSLDVCQLFFSNYEKSMNMNYISQNEKWRKKNQFLLYFFFCMMVFNLAKSISGLLLEKKNWSLKGKKRSDVHQQESK